MSPLKRNATMDISSLNQINADSLKVSEITAIDPRARRSLVSEMEDERPPLEVEDSSDEEDDKAAFGSRPLSECAKQYLGCNEVSAAQVKSKRPNGLHRPKESHLHLRP